MLLRNAIYAHSETTIVHRDLNPGNITLDFTEDDDGMRLNQSVEP